MGPIKSTVFGPFSVSPPNNFLVSPAGRTPVNAITILNLPEAAKKLRSFTEAHRVALHGYPILSKKRNKFIDKDYVLKSKRVPVASGATAVFRQQEHDNKLCQSCLCSTCSCSGTSFFGQRSSENNMQSVNNDIICMSRNDKNLDNFSTKPVSNHRCRFCLCFTCRCSSSSVLEQGFSKKDMQPDNSDIICMSENRNYLNNSNIGLKGAVVTSARHKIPTSEPDRNRPQEINVTELDKNFKSCHSLNTGITNQKISKKKFQ